MRQLKESLILAIDKPARSTNAVRFEVIEMMSCNARSPSVNRHKKTGETCCEVFGWLVDWLINWLTGWLNLVRFCSHSRTAGGPSLGAINHSNNTNDAPEIPAIGSALLKSNTANLTRDVLTSLQDFHVAKLNDFMHSRANITALRLVDMQHHIADDLLRGQDTPMAKVSASLTDYEVKKT